MSWTVKESWDLLLVVIDELGLGDVVDGVVEHSVSARLLVVVVVVLVFCGDAWLWYWWI